MLRLLATWCNTCVETQQHLVTNMFATPSPARSAAPAAPFRAPFWPVALRPAALWAAALCMAFVVGGPLHAEEEEDADADQAAEQVQPEEASDEEWDAVEEVIVTGSRLRRNTYSSISPLQIITADVKREAGLVDPGEIIQESTASSGVQIDLSFNGFVLDDGPGVVPANLRGLGSARTLVLVNGRRVGYIGVEGAPQAVDLGALPGALVSSYELLLDGASSIYGSDAVGGVANVKLRKDFDGFEIGGLLGRPAHPKGDADNLYAAWGKNFDRGFVGMGVEYERTEPVSLQDRPWTSGCDRHIEIDQAGRIRHQEQFYNNVYRMRWDECRIGSLAGRVSVPRAGSIYYTPGRSNGGWPNFSESSLYGFGVDNDGDDEADVSFREHSLNGRTNFEHLFAARKTVSGMVYGEYTMEGEANLSPYFEVLYTDLDYYVDNGVYQLFPGVPARNPYNICNPEGAGVDCGLAFNELLNNPHFIEDFANRFSGLCGSLGIPAAFCTPATFGQLGPPLGPRAVTPIAAVLGDRTRNWRHTQFSRTVVGLSGDLPMLNKGSFSGWAFDVSLGYSQSQSTSTRPGIRDDRLDLALGFYSQQQDSPCVNDIDDATRTARGLRELASDVMPGCVPVNMFAGSLYAGVVGDFATPAEREYLFDNRDFDTVLKMTLFSAYVSGTVFNMPAGSVAAGIGAEYRVDEIDSIPDHVARDGLFFGFFADGGAVGKRTVQEIFGEIEFPLVGGRVGAKEVDLNLSVRWTDDEYYGGAWTGSAKLGWRPVDSLLVRGTYGTSYRAPNLRELFLQPQTGFQNVYDPCLIPDDAIDPISNGYNPDLDDRDAHVLENCRRHGVDPTAASNDGFNVYSVEVESSGALGLDEETSESLSFGFSWEQSFTTAFDLSLGVMYYKISIDNTIVEPSTAYIVYDCYLSETGGTFCPRISRQADPERPLFDRINRGFINRDNETVRGVDFNLTFEKTVTVFDRPIDVNFNVTANRMIEFYDVFLNDTGEPDRNEYHREFFNPERTAIADLRVTYSDWFMRWQTVYTSKVHQDSAFDDEFDEALTGGSDTCQGPPDDLLCRDYRTAGDHRIHRLSFGYNADTWNVVVGARNLFDEPPPLVDSNETSYQANNASFGYSLEGRTYFLSFNADFRED